MVQREIFATEVVALSLLDIVNTVDSLFSDHTVCKGVEFRVRQGTSIEEFSSLPGDFVSWSLRKVREFDFVLLICEHCLFLVKLLLEKGVLGEILKVLLRGMRPPNSFSLSLGRSKSSRLKLQQV